jgi:hypothetical protein
VGEKRRIRVKVRNIGNEASVIMLRDEIRSEVKVEF